MGQILELARFTVAPADEEAFLAARPAVVVELRRRFPALKSLQLARLDDGVWVDVAVWDDREAARSAAEEACDVPLISAWMSHVDRDLSMELGEIVDPVA